VGGLGIAIHVVAKASMRRGNINNQYRSIDVKPAGEPRALVCGLLAGCLGGMGHAAAPNGDGCGHRPRPNQSVPAGATRASTAHHSATLLPRATGVGGHTREPPAAVLLRRRFGATRFRSALSRAI
jgi:hypothetical protein